MLPEAKTWFQLPPGAPMDKAAFFRGKAGHLKLWFKAGDLLVGTGTNPMLGAERSHHLLPAVQSPIPTTIPLIPAPNPSRYKPELQ